MWLRGMFQVRLELPKKHKFIFRSLTMDNNLPWYFGYFHRFGTMLFRLKFSHNCIYYGAFRIHLSFQFNAIVNYFYENRKKLIKISAHIRVLISVESSCRLFERHRGLTQKREVDKPDQSVINVIKTRGAPAKTGHNKYQYH